MSAESVRLAEMLPLRIAAPGPVLIGPGSVEESLEHEAAENAANIPTVDRMIEFMIVVVVLSVTVAT